MNLILPENVESLDLYFYYNAYRIIEVFILFFKFVVLQIKKI